MRAQGQNAEGDRALPSVCPLPSTIYSLPTLQPLPTLASVRPPSAFIHTASASVDTPSLTTYLSLHCLRQVIKAVVQLLERHVTKPASVNHPTVDLLLRLVCDVALNGRYDDGQAFN